MSGGQAQSEKVTLWTTVPGTTLDEDHRPVDSGHGQTVTVNLAYADFKITECKVTIHDPSEELVRQLLAMVIIEANPLDQALDLLDGSVWVQDPRFAPTLMPRWRSFTGWF